MNCDVVRGVHRYSNDFKVPFVSTFSELPFSNRGTFALVGKDFLKNTIHYGLLQKWKNFVVDFG